MARICLEKKPLEPCVRTSTFLSGKNQRTSSLLKVGLVELLAAPLALAHMGHATVVPHPHMPDARRRASTCDLECERGSWLRPES